MKRRLVAEDGAAYVRERLSRENPKQVIPQLQEEHGLADPGGRVKPLLPLLDLHQVSRYEVHSGLLERLKSNLLEHVQSGSMDESRLGALLEATFPYIAVPELQPLVFEVFSAHRHIPDFYLHKIRMTAELYAQCPIDVKRQIWRLDSSSFRDHIMPLIEAYQRDPSVVNARRELRSHGMGLRRARRSNDVVRSIVRALGRDKSLYVAWTQLLRAALVRTKQPALCSLRMDVLMLMHDEENETVQEDPCRMLAWHLDACVRHHTIEARHIKELTAILDEVKAGNPLIADMAMILGDPSVIHVVAGALLNALRNMSPGSAIKESSNVQWLAGLIQQGQAAASLLEAATTTSSRIRVPRPEKEFLNVFLPHLLTLLAAPSVPTDTRTRSRRSKRARTDTVDDESADVDVEESGEIKDAPEDGEVEDSAEEEASALEELFATSQPAMRLVSDNALCREVFLQFAVERLEAQHVTAALLAVDVLGRREPTSQEETAALIVSFTAALLSRPDAGQAARLAVLRKMLLPAATTSALAHVHALKLLLDNSLSVRAAHAIAGKLKTMPSYDEDDETMVSLHARVGQRQATRNSIKAVLLENE